MSLALWPFSAIRRLRSKYDPDRLAGDAARDTGDWGKAAAAYRRYLQRRPRHAAVWIRLGNMLKECGRLAEADEAYARATTLAPSQGAAHRLRGQLHARLGDCDGAAFHYAEAWRQDQDFEAGRALTRPEQLANLAHLQDMAGGSWRINGAIDGLRDLALEGWAWDPTLRGQPVSVEISMGGRSLGIVWANRSRKDIVDAGLGPENCGFRFELGPFLDLSSAPLDARIVESGEMLAASPFDLSQTAGLRRWLQRSRPLPGAPKETPVISIITPVHDVRSDWFEELAASVLGQGDGRWQWILVDDGSTLPALKARLAEIADNDSRVLLLSHPAARGTAAATNTGLRRAVADHVLFLDHDDQLEPEAVARLAEAAAAGADVIYGDEAVTGADLRDLKMLAARPAFSWRYYLSHPYFVHPLCIRRSIMASGQDEALSISADVDMVLRAVEQAKVIVHQPGVLYRWRTHDRSMGHQARQDVSAATMEAVRRHLKRLGVEAGVSPGVLFNTYRIDFEDPGGRVLVVIPTRDRADLLRTCLQSLRDTTAGAEVDIVVIDHESTEPALLDLLASLEGEIRVMRYEGPFNYSRMNNLAVAAFAIDHRFVLFLNNDIEALASGWLERLRALAAMSDVGAVGATLLYPDGRIQHAGVVIGPGGYAEHAMKFAPFEIDGLRNPGYNCSLTAVRDWSAVTGACMMVRTEIFREVGGFDETLPVGFNDTDLCLRLRQHGLNIITDGWAVLRHHESATRARDGNLSHPEDAARFAQRWEALIQVGDPFYNPMLSLERDHSVEHPDTDRLSPRMTRHSLTTLKLQE